MMLCECGCGQEVSKEGNRYINGHYWKGKHHSEETKKKICKSRIGQKLSEETKKKISKSHIGKNNPFYGKKFSEETLRKMSESRIGLNIGMNHPFYGKHHSEETRKKMSESRIGMKFSEEHKDKISGENSSNWLGGISFEPYCHKFNNKLKEEIREQYDRKCFNCGKNEQDNIRRLSIHHIYYDKEEGCNDKKFTLIPLCISCHSKTNSNRKYWQKLFLDKLNKD